MGVQDDYNEAWEQGAKDATERCALLVEMRADIARVSARRLRQSGTITVRNLWPLFSKSVVVLPRYERAARDMEEVAHAFEIVARCIRAGYDPREPGEDEKIDAE